MLVGLSSFLEALGEINFLALSSFWRAPAFLGSRPLPSSKPATSVESVSAANALVLSCLPLPPLKMLMITLGPPGSSRLIYLS